MPFFDALQRILAVGKSIIVAAILLDTPGLTANEAFNNWLLGGRWVREGVPCFANDGDHKPSPQGMVFLDQSVRIWTPADLPISTVQVFSSAYRSQDSAIKVELRRSDGQEETLLFRRQSDGSALDDQGIRFVRCYEEPVG